MTFQTVEQLQAQIASLTAENQELRDDFAAEIEQARELVGGAYVEGFSSGFACRLERELSLKTLDQSWRASQAFAALQPKEGAK